MTRAQAGHDGGVTSFRPQELEFSDAWIDGEESARWRSASALGPGTGAQSSGSSILEVEPGCRLGRHTDSAEETVVVLSGEAEVEVEGLTERVPAGGLALVPKDAPHVVRNAGEGVMRFAAVYAGADVVSRYEQPVQPSGEHERSPVG
jgi:quercetin dioxygenase-like cupin family protein